MNQPISWQIHRLNVYNLIGEQQANKLKTRKMIWQELYEVVKSVQNEIYDAITQMFQEVNKEADEETRQEEIYNFIREMIENQSKFDQNEMHDNMNEMFE